MNGHPDVFNVIQSLQKRLYSLTRTDEVGKNQKANNSKSYEISGSSFNDFLDASKATSK